MALDPDSHAVLEMLKAGRGVPTAGTDAIAYRAASEKFVLPPSAVTVDHVEDLRVPGPAGDLRLRLYRDAGSEAAPLIVYFHGGGFVGSGIETHDDLCRRLVAATGWAVASLEYRLSPECRFPGALEDCHAALRWAAGVDAAARGIDRARIVVMGDSAGGNLAAATALLARARGGPALAGQFLLYPMLTTACDGGSYDENATGYFLTSEACRWYWEQYAAPGAARDDPLMAPLFAEDLTGLPPATIVTAGYDPLRDDGAAYAARLAEAGVDTVYRCIAGTFHAFLSFGDLAASRKATALIAERLGPARAEGGDAPPPRG